MVVGLSRRDHVTKALLELGWNNIDGIVTERDMATRRHLIVIPKASQLLRERALYRSDVSVRHTPATADGQLPLPKRLSDFEQRSFSAWKRPVSER